MKANTTIYFLSFTFLFGAIVCSKLYKPSIIYDEDVHDLEILVELLEKRQSENYDSQTSLQKIRYLFYRFEKVLQFLEQNKQNINLDGLYGIRISQGALISYFEEKIDKNAYKEVDEAEYEKLRWICKNLLDRLTLLTDSAIEQVEKDDPYYFEQFKFLIDKPFVFKMRKDHSLNENFYEEPTFKKNFDEQFSDKCYSMLLGTVPNEDGKKEICSTTDKCLEYYTIPNTSGYFLTHQLLFFIMSKHVNCSSTIIERLRNYISTSDKNLNLRKALQIDAKEVNSFVDDEKMLFNYYCSKVFIESNKISENSHVKMLPKDLFIEQLALCSMVSYNEFLREDWLKLIFRFQQENGCFGQIPLDSIGKLSSNDLPDEIVDSLLDSRRQYLKRYLLKALEMSMMHGREKRVDKSMKFGCSSHETGLAIGLFGLEIKERMLNL